MYNSIYAVDRTQGFKDWSFSTVRCWGERAPGRYQLIITDTTAHYTPDLRTGTLVKWSLTLHGSSLTHEQYQQRIRYLAYYSVRWVIQTLLNFLNFLSTQTTEHGPS